MTGLARDKRAPYQRWNLVLSDGLRHLDDEVVLIESSVCVCVLGCVFAGLRCGCGWTEEEEEEEAEPKPGDVRAGEDKN